MSTFQVQYEVLEIREATNNTICDDFDIPDSMANFLEAIPNTTSLKEIFLHLINQPVNPFYDTGVYWFKTSLEALANFLNSKYVPLTDHIERDVLCRVWGFLDTAYDYSVLKFRRFVKKKRDSSLNMG